MKTKFPPKKDWKVGGIFILVLVIIGIPVLLTDDLPTWLYIIEFVPVVFIGWLWFGTAYSITDQTINYRSGPFRGSIPISKIKSIKKNEFSWIGLRPSLSFDSLKVKYGKYHEIYLAPANESKFLEIIQQYNPDVIIR